MSRPQFKKRSLNAPFLKDTLTRSGFLSLYYGQTGEKVAHSQRSASAHFRWGRDHPESAGADRGRAFVANFSTEQYDHLCEMGLPEVAELFRRAHGIR